jgi:NAD(P)-dependent dehydrogenase (short-subunit alcohol dehydrogenase family)
MTERLPIGDDQVMATVRREDAIADMPAQHGNRLAVSMLDFTDTAAIREFVGDAFDRMGRNDVAVSNAGHGLFGAAEELTDAQIDDQIAANLTGSIQFIRAAISHLRQQGGGKIVQLSTARAGRG